MRRRAAARDHGATLEVKPNRFGLNCYFGTPEGRAEGLYRRSQKAFEPAKVNAPCRIR